MKEKITINQFHPGAAAGDAITDQMLAIRSLLREHGYKSEIYCQQVPDELKHELKSIDSYRGNRNGVLIVHHSMGFDGIDRIIDLPDKEILIYHNITPERFLQDESTKQYARLGLEQLQTYFERVNYVISASNYNRRDLLGLGYQNKIDVMPVSINIDRLDGVEVDEEILDKLKETTNILFVGRLADNKCQEDVIRAFAVYYRNYNRSSRLFLVGDNSWRDYVGKLQSEVQRLGLGKAVCFTGKVSEQELKAYYSAADLFLCMSEHEGFGVPLLEAMKSNVPVIAYRSSAIPETMDGAGVVVSEKDYDCIGALMDEVLQDASLRDGILDVQRKRLDRLQQSRTEKILFKAIENCLKQKRRKTVQVQGHMEGSYSLAAVNRDLSEALAERDFADISICSTDGELERKLDYSFFSDKNKAEQMWKQAQETPFPDVVIRNAYPPSTKGMKGGLNLYSWGWEESLIPPSFIAGFNRDLQGIGTMSQYVTEKLLENGIKIPVRTMGVGVKLPENFAELQSYPLKSKKKIKFLHISSAFPRKGVDVLLRGYYQAFTCRDDVCLVLKTFPNPHNNVEKILAELDDEFQNHPEVEWIDKDLSQESLYGLYKATDCYVSMARGEGFGLPVAEAMLAKLPVIVAANSGVLDFCNQETAFLVSCDMTEAHTHFSDGHGGKKSYWYEPKLEELVMYLKKFALGQYTDVIRDKVKKAHELISKRFTWSAVAERWEEFIDDLEANQYRPKVGMVTTWNSKCGIAEYTKMMVEASEKMVDYHIFANKGVELIRNDEGYVERLWQANNPDVREFISGVMNSACDIIHFQYSPGFMSEHILGETIVTLSSTKKVVVTFHETKILDMNEAFVSALNKCASLVLHQPEDIERLKSSGVRADLLHLIPLGQVVVPTIPVHVGRAEIGLEDRGPIIGSYGFLLSHKGVKETIQAMPHILEKYPDAVYMPVCSLYPIPMSEEYLEECQAMVERLGIKNHVKFVTDFLSNDESMKYLHCCDIIAFPYGYTEQSASGAVRFGFAAGRPVLTTEQKIFNEFQGFVHQIKSNDPKDIADGVLEILNSKNNERVNEMLSYQKKYLYSHSWQETVSHLYDLYRNA